MADSDDRHSEALEVEIIADPDQKAQQEAKNGLRQFDSAIEQIEFWLQPDRPFKLRPSAIQTLNRIALQGLSLYPGIYRPGHIVIGGSKHTPPASYLVPELVEHMCEYVNENWSKSSIHLASYVLWRLNWIHPFVDGNGRTTRAISFVVLCARLGYRVPGADTIPEQISRNKRPYYEALEKVDASCHGDSFDVAAIETLMESWLTNQLASVIHHAKAILPPNNR
jgi:Fic family protein